jgi:uncharacterized protein (DUF1501 family)
MALAAAALLPPVFARAASTFAQTGAAGRYGDGTILVVVQLSGGNDGLNTVVPYGLDGYRGNRASLGVAEAEVLPITDRLGLHPELGPLLPIYQAGKLAIVQGVGYPNPNLSHFRSMDIWHTGVPDRYEKSGWLARYLGATAADEGNPLYAVSVTNGLNRAFAGDGVTVPAINSIEAFQFRTDPRYGADRSSRQEYASWIYGQDYTTRPLESFVSHTAAAALSSADRVQAATAAYPGAVEYPRSPLANSLRSVARLIAADLGTRVYYTALGGFDTHSAQAAARARLLGGFAQSVDAFQRDVASLGKGEQVLLMAFSEFGRRVAENGSLGTDHGTAGPMFIMGERVRGGLYGDHPSLQDLDGNRNLRYGVDFRSVYATALDGWLGAESQLVLGGRFENVGFV